MVDYLRDPVHRTALYWIAMALVYAYLAFLATRRWIGWPTIPIGSIAASTATLAIGFSQAAVYTLGWVDADSAFGRFGPGTETVRVAAVISAIWMTIEFRARRVGVAPDDEWDGNERRSWIRRRRDRGR